MINEGGTENKSNSNSQRNRIVLGAIIILALLALLTLLANPGLFVPPNGNAEAQNQPPPANDNGSENEDNSSSPGQGNSSYNATNENAILVIINNSSANANESEGAAGDASEEIVNSTVTDNDDNKSTNTNQNPNGNDGGGHTVFVSGLASNHRPVASEGSVTTHMGIPVVIHLNASDSDGDSLTYIVLTDPIHGSLMEPDISNGEVMYTPDPGYQGTDHFTFRVSDDKLESKSALITITIIDNDDDGTDFSNHDPEVNDIEVESVENKALLVDLIGSTVDIDGNPVSLSIVDPPTNGIAELNDNGTATYIPDPDYVGTDSFTYRANDGKTNSNVGLVSITIKKSYILQMEDNTFSYGVEIYSGKRATTENVGPQSILIGKDIDTIILWLSKEGDPQGHIEIGVFNDDLSVKKLFGTIDASDITESADNPGKYQFSLIESDLPYTIEEGDRIGIKFTGGDIFNFIAVQVDDDPSGPFDGINTYKSFYDTEWVDIENADMSMSLILSK